MLKVDGKEAERQTMERSLLQWDKRLKSAPFGAIIYRLGSKYLTARSDEDGYANCEVEW